MATNQPQPQPTASVNQDTLITLKVVIYGNSRRFKLALRDLGANVLPQKLRLLLGIPAEAQVFFERFSDSAGTYIPLDSDNPAIYKQLFRAAKAKLKLRLRATVIPSEMFQSAQMASNATTQPVLHKNETPDSQPSSAPPATRPSYLDTVLSYPLPIQDIPYLPACDFYAPSRQAHFTSVPAPAGLNLINTSNDTLFPTATGGVGHQNVIPTFHNYPVGAFCIDCNKCGKSIPNEHYHCSTCDAGDFDLCQACVDDGITCNGEEHWLIKRSIRGGVVVPSVTETVAPNKGADKANVAKLEQPPRLDRPEVVLERTCNACISELPEHEFVTCKNCPDFDLCLKCFLAGEHGHHPAHQFEPMSKNLQKITAEILSLCTEGRGVRHRAVCDGCDNAISGVRHKCLNCPDWDYCSTCVLSAEEIHPGHRFAPLYEPISDIAARAEVHRGIYCDGALCTARRRKSYIRGDRYKCAVCNDTDFCANCEASPMNIHNITHPLIKFRTPVRHVSVTTLGENNNGEKLEQMGDIPRARNASTETTRVAPSAHAATQAPTVATVRPVEMHAAESVKTETQAEDKLSESGKTGHLKALFESESTTDGTKFAPNRLVSQSWTLRNPGPEAWPAGCAVYYIGGDDMRNLDSNRASSIRAMTSATRSNVLESSLEPGKTAVFKVLLKAPAREGRVISYWRVKTPDGRPFGNKLWVDIMVSDTPAELPEKHVATPPSTPAEAVEPAAREGGVKSEASSTMIFPKLDKESPISSVHEAASAQTPMVKPTNKTAEEELLDDVESLELEESETEDGFLTDEEYDILDASDEDFLAEAQKAVQQ